ncbi:MAG: YSC84-related protein [Tepidisphaeraceae bacterium]
MRTVTKWASALAMVVLAAGCSTAPRTDTGKAQLEEDSDTTLKRLYAKDPSLSDFVKNSSGYAVFPGIGKGGLVVGGAYGRGVVYADGQQIGYSDVTQVNVGALAGGQSYAEVIVFQSPTALANFKAGKFTFSADASAVAINSGAAKTARYSNGVAVFVEPIGGLMAEAAVGGQKFSFEAK